jgi:hypothetical protein
LVDCLKSSSSLDFKGAFVFKTADKDFGEVRFRSELLPDQLPFS